MLCGVLLRSSSSRARYLCFSCALILCVYLYFWTRLRYRKSDNHVVVLLPGKLTLRMCAVGWVEECVIWHVRAHSMRSPNTATNAYRHTHTHTSVTPLDKPSTLRQILKLSPRR